MNKQAYITPLVEVLEVYIPHTMLEHFSSNADIGDIGEMDPEVIDPTAPY